MAINFVFLVEGKEMKRVMTGLNTTRRRRRRTKGDDESDNTCGCYFGFLGFSQRRWLVGCVVLKQSTAWLFPLQLHMDDRRGILWQLSDAVMRKNT